MQILLTSWFVFVLALVSSAQYRFHTITIEDGLTQNSITDIFQDRDGFLWFGTQDGISRYDGYSLKNYNISGDDSTSLSDNYLWGFAEDTLGYIWCCSRDGINRIDKITGSCKAFYPDPSTSGIVYNQSTSLVVFKGYVYASFAGQMQSLPVQSNYNEVIYFQPLIWTEGAKPAEVYKFHVSMDDKSLYVLTDTGVIQFGGSKNHNIEGFSAGDKGTFLPSYQEHKDTIWFSDGENLYYLLTQSNQVGKLPVDFDNSSIYSITQHLGCLWVSTESGIYIIQNNQIKRRITKNEKYKNGLPSNYVSALFKDRNQQIWIGTSGNGICQYIPKRDQFKYIGKESFGRSEMVRSMIQKGHELYVCIENDVMIFELSKTRFTDALFIEDIIQSKRRLNLTNNQISTPSTIGLGPDSSLIVGTYDGQIVVLDDRYEVNTVIDLPIHNKNNARVSSFIVGKNKDLWVTTFNGVYVLDSLYQPKTNLKPYSNGLSTNYLLSVYEDLNETIWLGGNTGIFFYDESKNRFNHIPYNKNDLKHSPGFNFVTSFIDIGDGYLWMSTYGGGLSRMNKRTYEFQHFTSSEGLSNNVLNGLLYDGTSSLWMSSNKGISAFNLNTQHFTNYNTTDGLYFSEFKLNAYRQNRWGDMMFGTPAGLVAFNPNQMKASNIEIPLVLTRLDVNYIDESHRLKADELKLFPKDKSVTIHYAGLHFNKSDRIRYRYKLEGYDADWIETEDIKATYTSLPDGEYLFSINTTNADGKWNLNPVDFHWKVFPPYYKSWWFLTSIILFSLTVLILVIRHFSQLKIKKRLRELKIKEEVHKEKQRISRDLHDTVGAQITYLISSIDYEANVNYKGQKNYELLGDKARNIMTQLRNVLWVLDKEEVSFTAFSRKVSDYAIKVFAPTNIRCVVDIDDNQEINLPPVVLSNLFSILQEAINNIIKHSKASIVTIDFGVANDILEITVQDNGIGFDASAEKEGHFGIKNMLSRTQDIGGTCQISASEVGVTIKIQIPITN